MYMILSRVACVFDAKRRTFNVLTRYEQRKSLTDYRDSVSRVTLTQSCFLELRLRAWLKQPATSQTPVGCFRSTEVSVVRASEVETPCEFERLHGRTARLGSTMLARRPPWTGPAFFRRVPWWRGTRSRTCTWTSGTRRSPYPYPGTGSGEQGG